MPVFFAHLITSNRHAVVDKGELECHTVAVLLRCRLAPRCASHSCTFRVRSDVGTVYRTKSIRSLIDVYFLVK